MKTNQNCQNFDFDGLQIRCSFFPQAGDHPRASRGVPASDYEEAR